jgi:hypothetical protein
MSDDDESNLGPTPEEKYWLGLYSQLIQRHKHTPADWAAAMTGIRLFAARVKFSGLVGLLRAHGAPAVAKSCYDELLVRQQFLTQIYQAFDITDEERAYALMMLDQDYALAERPESKLRMLRVLDRLVTREAALRSKRGMVH